MDVVHLTELEGGNGPLWGLATDDLNATLLAWDEGRGTPEHVNEHLDVVLVVVAGEGTVRVVEVDHEVRAGDALLIPKGASRRITAGRRGLRYLTVHRRRGGLTIGRVGE